MSQNKETLYQVQLRLIFGLNYGFLRLTLSLSQALDRDDNTQNKIIS